MQKKFQVPRSHSIGEKCDSNFKLSHFSPKLRPRNMKFGLHRESIWINMQKKFQVPRSHSIGEMCDSNFKLSSHFSPKLRPRNMKFGLHRASIWVNI